MPRLHFLCRIGFAVSLLSTFGCAASNQNRDPEVAGASEQVTYANRFPAEYDALGKQVQANEQYARSAMDSWEGMPAEVKSADKLDVRGYVDKADRSGRSSGYVQERREMDKVREFFTEEKDEINRKVAGSVDYAAQQKGCESKELGGAAAYGLKEAVDKRIDHRLQQANEARYALDEDRASIDKATAERLEKRLDEIANVSYLVHVGIVDARNQLADRRSEVGNVKSTLDKAIERARSSNRPDAKKRVAELEKQRASIDESDAQAKTALEGVDERIKKLKDDYRQKLDALKEQLPNGK